MRVKYPGLVIAGALILSLPMAPGLLSGAIPGSTAALRFLIALVACWLFGAILSWVIGTYAEQSAQAEVVRAIEEAQRAEQNELTATSAGTGTDNTR